MAEPDDKNVERVRALLSPVNVAIVGASDKPGSWSRRVFQTLTRHNFKGGIYPVNPRGGIVWERECHASLEALPEKPDHVVVLVPGAAAVEAIRDAGRAGARSATVFSSGFGEGGGEAGRELGAALALAVRESGLAVSGPNCMGNLAAPFGFVTLPDDRITELPVGPVGLFGQSGGIVMAIFRALRSRGIICSHALTTGNEAGLAAPDYIRFMAADPHVKVICCFIEAIRDADDFLGALDTARRAGKPVIAIKIGGSRASRAAALAHTGSLAGSLASFDALCGPRGLIRAGAIDELVELAEYFVHARAPRGARAGAITFSGGLKGLLLEGAERHGVEFPALAKETTAALAGQLGVGTSLGNPVDAGFAALSSSDVYFNCVRILLDDPNIDVLLVQEELPLREGQNLKAGNLRTVDAMAAEGGKSVSGKSVSGKPVSGKPVAVVSMASYMYSDFTREFRQGFPHLPVLHEADKALKCIAQAARYGAALAAEAPPAADVSPLSADETACLAEAVKGPGGLSLLGEAASKRLLTLNGIAAPREAAADSAEGAALAARAVGFPVVMKLVSDDVAHKSDVGGVILGIVDEAGARAAFAAIRAGLARARPGAHFGGVLVARQVIGGLELVIGAHRDPEMGLVTMFGAGGVLLELIADVRFGPVPLSAAQARAMIAGTKAGALLKGYRGAAALDAEAAAQALVSLSRLAARLGGRLESIDVNPLTALPAGQGVVALDALVALRDGFE